MGTPPCDALAWDNTAPNQTEPKEDTGYLAKKQIKS